MYFFVGVRLFLLSSYLLQIAIAIVIAKPANNITYSYYLLLL